MLYICYNVTINLSKGRYTTMDIKEAAASLVKDKDPVKAVEKATGIDLPDEKINSVVKEVASKVSVDDVKEKAGDIIDKFKK